MAVEFGRALDGAPAYWGGPPVDGGLPIHGRGGVTLFGRPPTIDDLPVLQSSPFESKSRAYANFHARLTLNPQRPGAPASIIEGYAFGRTPDEKAIYFSTRADDRGDFVSAKNGTRIPLANIAALTVTNTCWQPAPPEMVRGTGVTVSNC